jgi:hypothetical protein
MATSITFLDGRTFPVGQRISFDTKYGSVGSGTIAAIIGDKLRLADITYVEHGTLDGWPLATGGDYDRIRDHGIHGGEVTGR